MGERLQKIKNDVSAYLKEGVGVVVTFFAPLLLISKITDNEPLFKKNAAKRPSFWDELGFISAAVISITALMGLSSGLFGKLQSEKEKDAAALAQEPAPSRMQKIKTGVLKGFAQGVEMGAFFIGFVHLLPKQVKHDYDLEKIHFSKEMYPAH